MGPVDGEGADLNILLVDLAVLLVFMDYGLPSYD